MLSLHQSNIKTFLFFFERKFSGDSLLELLTLNLWSSGIGAENRRAYTHFDEIHIQILAVSLFFSLATNSVSKLCFNLNELHMQQKQ